MDADRFARIKELLIALEDVPLDQRAAHLDRACGGDVALRAEVETLLHEGAPTIMLTGRLGARIAPMLAAPGPIGAPPSSEIGPYRLLELLGEGGMGVVYRAEQTTPIRREVAVKLVRYGMDSERIVSRFESERQAIAMMEHPYIARVFDAGAAPDGRPYFVMELVRGEAVTDYCAREAPPLAARLQLFLKICDAIQHAHQKGIIHRDLKPSNVLVTRNGTIAPKIIDFGIAKAVAESNAIPGSTLAGQVLGTPEYMSPEQAGVIDAGLDTRTDVYSLGVILYELISGKRPYELRNRTPAEIDRVLRTPPKPPSAIDAKPTWLRLPAADASSDIDAVALMAIERKPADRYGSVEQLADDVRRVLEHRPVRARTQTWAYRTSRFVRRNAFAVGTAIAFSLLLASSAVAVVRERNRALASEAQAVAEARRAQAETTKAVEVSRFLIELFRESDPARARGASITARELLDRGAKRIANELAGQDEIRATLMDTIGVVYRLLGLLNESEALIVDAIATRRRVLGNDHPDVAASLDNLGQVAREKNQFDASARLHEEALDIRRRTLGPRDPEVARSLNNLALVLRERGQYDEAERLAREALDIRRAALGSNHPEAIISLSNLADLETSRGRVDEAEKLHRDVLAWRRRHLPSGHPSVAVSLNNVAELAAQRGRLAEAEPLFREALSIRRTALGNDHADVTASLNNLASLLHDMGRLDEAEPLYREALAIDRQRNGNLHMDVAVDLNNLGTLLEDRGKFGEAGVLYEQSLGVRRRLLGNQHPSVATALNNLGRLRFVQGRLADAQRALQQAIDIRIAGGISEHPRQATTVMWLGRVRQQGGDLTAAEEHFTAALAIMRRVRATGGPETAAALVSLGKLLLQRGDPAKAEPLLVEALNWRRAHLPGGHRATHEAELALGECLLARARFAEAEPLLVSGVKGVPAVKGALQFDRAGALHLVVSLYERWGRPEAARAFRRQLRQP